MTVRPGQAELQEERGPEADEVQAAIRGLLAVARGVLVELDLQLALGSVLEAARDLTGARYAAVGVLNAPRTGLERFITAGLDEGVRRAIGAPPQGRGVLGKVISEQKPVRVDDIGEHPDAFGFPPGHPPMRSFLGVPITVAEQPFGSLYVTEKHDGRRFTAGDEEALVVLAEFAALAIDHARRYRRSGARRGELQRTVDALDAAVQISRALAGQTDLEKVLALVAQRARALVSAKALVIELCEHADLLVSAAAGDGLDGLVGQRLALEHTVASAAMLTGTTQRLEDPATRDHFERYGLGRLGVRAEAGLIVPLSLRGRAYGALVALDRRECGPRFTAHDQQLLEWFAASAATGLVTAVSVSAERERERLAAAERERGRWARELHEGTLQRLAALRLELASAQGVGDLGVLNQAVTRALDDLRSEITILRSLSFELRPAILDELGIESTIDALAAIAEREGIAVQVRLDYEHGRRPVRHTAEVDTAIYRVVQEALSNAQGHAHALNAIVTLHETEHTVEVTIRDDGAGFDPADVAAGFGLTGLRDRLEVLGGQLQIDSAPGKGTTIRAALPAQPRTTAAHPK